MTIIIWILGFAAYMGYLLYMTQRPSDVNLFLGLGSLIIGLLSFILNRKSLLIVSFLLLFGGVIYTYPIAMAKQAVWPWVGGLAVLLFFGSLSLRND